LEWPGRFRIVDLEISSQVGVFGQPRKHSQRLGASISRARQGSQRIKVDENPVSGRHG
jgi:hypothetical protein